MKRLLTVGGTGAAVGLAFGDGPVAVLSMAVAATGQIVWWVFKCNAALRAGLDVGQTVSLDYVDSGEMRLTDITGPIWLTRGSVLTVERYRSIATVSGREISFILPGELLADADIAFLEGHGPALETGMAPGPSLPFALEITPDRHRALVAAATRAVLKSADFLMPWVAGVFLISVAASVGSEAAIAGTVVFSVVLTLPGLGGVVRTRARLRSTYRVGQTVRAGLTDDGLVLSLAHSTRFMKWSDFSGIRITRDAVLLTGVRRRLAPDRTSVIPKDLFNADAIAQMSDGVAHRS